MSPEALSDFAETGDLDLAPEGDGRTDRADLEQASSIAPAAAGAEEPETADEQAQDRSESSLSTQAVEDVVEYRRFRPRGADRAKEQVRILESWQGTVESVQEDTFIARLTDRKGERSDLEAEIFVEEVSKQDRSLLRPGAVFYWSIGYRDTPGGRTRFSSLKFRRLPVWQKKDLERTEARARELESAGW